MRGLPARRVVFGHEANMVEVGSKEEIARSCHTYLLLSDEERTRSDLFRFWDYLFFHLATSSESAALTWSIIKDIAGMGLTDAQFIDLAAGPFEEMLVSLSSPLPSLFDEYDVDLARRLASHVWLSHATSSVRDWIARV